MFKNQTLLTRNKRTTDVNQIIDAIQIIDAKQTFDDAKRTNDWRNTNENERLTTQYERTNKRLTTQTSKCLTLRFKKKFSPGKLPRACFTGRNFDSNEKSETLFYQRFFFHCNFCGGENNFVKLWLTSPCYWYDFKV